MTKIVPLTKRHLDLAADSLSRAFDTDPLQCYVFPDADERRNRAPSHFRAMLDYGIRFGEVLTTEGNALGAAVWLAPDETNMTDERIAAVGLDRLPELVGIGAANRFSSVLNYLEPFHQNDVPEPHWYTMVVGVAPEAQGHGLGRALLQPILDRAALTGHSCYLETAAPNNVAFYRRLGFRVLREVVDPTSGLRLWTLRRDPSTPIEPRM